MPAQNLAAALHGWAMGRRSNFASVFFTTQWLGRILQLIAEKKIQQKNTFRAEKLNHQSLRVEVETKRKMAEIKPTQSLKYKTTKEDFQKLEGLGASQYQKQEDFEGNETWGGECSENTASKASGNERIIFFRRTPNCSITLWSQYKTKLET